MKKILVLFGNFTFEGEKALVHEVEHFVYIDEDKAEEHGDDNVNIYGAYLIPSKFKGQIMWDVE